MRGLLLHRGRVDPLGAHTVLDDNQSPQLVAVQTEGVKFGVAKYQHIGRDIGQDFMVQFFGTGDGEGVPYTLSVYDDLLRAGFSAVGYVVDEHVEVGQADFGITVIVCNKSR